MRACCDRGGRVSHSTPVTTAATKSTMNAELRQHAAEEPNESAHGAKVAERRAKEKARLDDRGACWQFGGRPPEFNLDTGRHPGDPRVRLRPIPVRVSDDGIYIQTAVS